MDLCHHGNVRRVSLHNKSTENSDSFSEIVEGKLSMTLKGARLWISH